MVKRERLSFGEPRFFHSSPLKPILFYQIRRHMHARSWTTQEINLLYSLRRRGVAVSEIARILNRTEGGIYKQLSKRGITTVPRWSDDELEFVKQHYRVEGVAYCSYHLGRSTAAIHKCVSVNKLFKDKSEVKSNTIRTSRDDVCDVDC